MRSLICGNCGTSFQVGKGNFKFCLECQTTAQKRRNFRASRNPKRYNTCPLCGKLKYKTSEWCIKCRTATWKGEKHPGWKGGKFFDPRDGYAHIRVGNKYMLEHRLVLEKKLGRPLKPNEVGHHLNGIRSDNRPENLIALPRKYHPCNTLIEALQVRIRELEQLHLPIQ